MGVSVGVADGEDGKGDGTKDGIKFVGARVGLILVGSIDGRCVGAGTGGTTTVSAQQRTG